MKKFTLLTSFKQLFSKPPSESITRFLGMDLKSLSGNWKQLQGSLKKNDPAPTTSSSSSTRKRPATNSSSALISRNRQDGTGSVKRRRFSASASASTSSTAAAAPAPATDNKPFKIRKTAFEPGFKRRRMGDKATDDGDAIPESKHSFGSKTEAVREGRPGDQLNAGLSTT